MDANEYQTRAALTAAPQNDADRLANAVLGLAGEAGELARLLLDAEWVGCPMVRQALTALATWGEAIDTVKKVVYQGHCAPARDEWQDDLNDVLTALAEWRTWYDDPQTTHPWASVPALPLARLDRPAVLDELGDAQWYVAQGARAVSAPLSTVMDGNLSKLERRYPDGRFDPARSEARAQPAPIPALMVTADMQPNGAILLGWKTEPGLTYEIQGEYMDQLVRQPAEPPFSLSVQGPDRVQVRAIRDDQAGPWSAWIDCAAMRRDVRDSTTSDRVVLPPVTELRIVKDHSASDGAVWLLWRPIAGLGYEMETSAPGRKTTFEGVTVPVWLNMGQQRYCVRIRAVTGAQRGPWSNTVLVQRQEDRRNGDDWAVIIPSNAELDAIGSAPSPTTDPPCRHLELVGAGIYEGNGFHCEYGRCRDCGEQVVIDLKTGALLSPDTLEPIPAPVTPPPAPLYTRWIVTRDQVGLQATVRHLNEQSARNEAERLARKDRGGFLVWQLVGRVAMPPSEPIWREAAIDDTEVPF